MFPVLLVVIRNGKFGKNFLTPATENVGRSRQCESTTISHCSSVALDFIYRYCKSSRRRPFSRSWSIFHRPRAAAAKSSQILSNRVSRGLFPPDGFQFVTAHGQGGFCRFRASRVRTT